MRLNGDEINSKFDDAIRAAVDAATEHIRMALRQLNSGTDRADIRCSLHDALAALAVVDDLRSLTLGAQAERLSGTFRQKGEEQMSETFAIGTEVEWTSQAQGSHVTKRGVVAAVIPAGADYRNHLTGLQRVFAKGWGLTPRKEESYAVHVPSPSGRGNGKLYWPYTSQLKRIGKSPDELKRAAAPELYEALAEIVDFIDATDTPGYDGNWHLEARAALAKARGEQ